MTRDKCFQCKKKLKSFDYFTLARIYKSLNNSTIVHFCNYDCLSKYIDKLEESK